MLLISNFRNGTGIVVVTYWFIANAEHSAPPVSIGFPGYVYPDESSCQMYDGVPCMAVDGCCYNAAKWCDANGENCRSDVRFLLTEAVVERNYWNSNSVFSFLFAERGLSFRR